MRYRDADHTYWVGRRQAVSVTRVLEFSGLVDASHYSRHDGEDFLERGRVVHDITARLDSRRLTLRAARERCPDRWLGFLEAWVRFKAESGFAAELVEHRVWCPDPLYAGTLDRVGRFPRSGSPAVVDLKNHNSGSVQKSVAYQLVAYGHALDPRKMFERYGVALHPDGSYKVTRFPLRDYIEDRDTFLRAAAQMHDSRDFMEMFGK